MSSKRITFNAADLPRFDRRFFDAADMMTVIGSGAIGGKASGLAFVRDLLTSRFPGESAEGITVSIPRLTVIATDFFDRFMLSNHLYDVVTDDTPDDYLAHMFQRAELPPELVGDLRALIASVRTPLAVRSSSLLEDAMYRPFAGVYATKMIPNNQPDIDTRFRKLVEAVKFVYASTFFASARDYMKAAGTSIAEEKMAVVIQEVVGTRFGDRFYPHLSGVARSYNFYPVGRAKPEEAVVNLALGLGKTIVDGGMSWSFTPAYPKITPPVASPSEMLRTTQTQFWAVNMGRPPEHDPVRETEYLVQAGLEDAEWDGTLKFTASTYRAADDRLISGIGPDGPRALTFAPILCDREVPLTDTIKSLLKVCEEKAGGEVEIEFAVTLDSRRGLPARLGFLQVRPMVVSSSPVDISDEEMQGENVLLSSDKVMGNGITNAISDIVYIRPEVFEARHTPTIAAELAVFNQRLVADGRKYLLIGFGRWGSSDPWLGIPVQWGAVSGAGAIVEATFPKLDVDLSQGSHFFHNLTSFQICYFMIRHSSIFQVDWGWLEDQQEIACGRFVRYVRSSGPLTIKVDGRTGKGVILK